MLGVFFNLALFLLTSSLDAINSAILSSEDRFTVISASAACSRSNNTWPSPRLCAAKAKPYKMAILALWGGFTSSEEISCFRTAVEMMLANINYRPDYLGDYELELHIATESDIFAGHLPQFVFDFYYEHQRTGSLRTTAAPIAIGPYQYGIDQGVYGRFMNTMFIFMQMFNFVHVQGIASVNPFQHPKDSLVYFNKVIRSGNSSDLISSYFGEPGELQNSIIGMMAFIASATKIVNWKEVAIAVDGKDFFPTGATAQQLVRRLSHFGIKVVHIAIDADYQELFSSIVSSRARIILSTLIANTCYTCAHLWCAMYQAGIRAPHYVVLMQGPGICLPCLGYNNREYYDGKLLIGVCSFKTQLESVRIILFSEFSSFINVTIKRLPDYSGIAAEDIDYLRYLNSVFFTQWLKAKGCPFYNGQQHGLYTDLVAAVWMLNATEQELVRRFNATLRDYVPGRNDFAELVTEIEGQLASKYEFKRPTWLASYLSFEPFYIMQIEDRNNKTANGSLKIDLLPRFIAKVNASSREIEYLKEPNWATETGQPPKDLSIVIRKNGTFNVVAFVTVAASTAIVSIFQLLLVIRGRKLAAATDIYFDIEGNFIISIGCLILNCSTALILLGTIFFSLPACFVGPALTLLGLAAVHGVLLAKALSLNKYVKLNRYITSMKRTRSLFNLDFHEGQRENQMKRSAKKLKQLVGLIVLISAVTLLIWFVSDPFVEKTEVSYQNEPLFDEELDTFYDIQFVFCHSASRIYWIAMFTACHVMLLAFSGFLAFTSVKKMNLKMIRRRFSTDVKLLRLVIINDATIFVFVILLLIVLNPSKPSINSYLQLLSFSLGQLVFSLTSSIAVYFPVFKR